MSKYNKTAIVIEYPATDEWAVSFTDHNPEQEDSIDCKSESDAWKLKKIWDEAMANTPVTDAEPSTPASTRAQSPRPV